MSIQTGINLLGAAVWRVRWQESGRGSRMNLRSFAATRDAERFEAELTRDLDLGAHAPGVMPERPDGGLPARTARMRVIWSSSRQAGPT